MDSKQLARQIDAFESELKIVTILIELLNEISIDDFHFKSTLDKLHSHSLSLKSSYHQIRPEMFNKLL